MSGSDRGDPFEESQQLIIEQAREKFSETVIRHWMNPVNFGALENPDGRARITGPCGDTIEIFLKVRDGIVAQASFLTDGCGTSIASGSMAVELATGRHLKRAAAISQQEILDALGGLPPESEHCALLASNTLREALRDYASSAQEPCSWPWRLA